MIKVITAVNKKSSLQYITYFVIFLLSACSAAEKKATLHSIDKTNINQKSNNRVFIKPKSAKEIRDAYTHYLATANKSDKSRQLAISRLAELEFEVSNKLMLEQEESSNHTSDEIDEQLYTYKLKKTIELLRTSITDYPKAKGNDKILYQLAKAYDQVGDYENSIQTLHQLSNKYPKSSYYVEAQFRLAETNFSKGDYIAAEDAYTEVIISRNNYIFYEKAIFKRGWARFKQSFYEEAVNDYLQAVTYHQFDELKKLNQSEKDQFEEYFRAIGLSFSNLGGAEALQTFFRDKPEFKYLYYTYSVVSNIYLKQERYSDAADAMKQFIQQHPDSENIPDAQLKIVKVWQKSIYTEKLYEAIESFYVSYNMSSLYWKKKNINAELNKSINQSLKKYILLMAEYFHSEYQQKPKTKSYNNATQWYKRYLKDYSAYAQKDNIYFRYAEILSQHKNHKDALYYYEIAAYDEELILNKKAAYATIILTEKLYNSKISTKNKTVLLNKHINYSLLYAQLYAKDKRSQSIIMHAAKLAYSSQQYTRTIELTNLVGDKSSSSIIYSANLLRAQSYFKLKQYAEAESVYSAILDSNKLKDKDKNSVKNRLALSVYKQAEILRSQKNIIEASHHFMRISEIAKTSEIAITGNYDAIALYMNNKLWPQAISAIQHFQKSFPKNKFSQDVTRKLSVAYLNSNQSIKAAEQFEKISDFENNKEIKMTALWQAAELYESKKNYASAIRSYSEYANLYKKPYSQYMEAMFKLTKLYDKPDKKKLRTTWQQRIISADKNTHKKNKTERTRYISSITSLGMAREKDITFNRYHLVAPLKTNLRKKKKAMQQAVKLYGQASNYGVSEITTESTFAIAQIYFNFSKALLESERPRSLKGEELEQYNILLEDQAFPFEDKAIEFYEINLTRIKEDIYDDWVAKSMAELKTLFPVKYNRKSKIDGYISAIQ